jgi:DNA-binding CsgD family transcriptional regulator
MDRDSGTVRLVSAAYDRSSPVLSARVGVSPIMIGRVGPLARLVGLVEAAEVASGDDSAVALVSGEPGIGKTRLVEEFVRELDTEVEVVVVRAEPGSVNRPYDAFARLLPRDDEWVVDDGDAMTDRLVGAFSPRLTGQPKVLVVEDVHWLDDASARVVDSLARQPWPSFVLLATYRTGALRRGSPGGELVRRLEQTHAVEQIRLDRLDHHDIGALINAIIGEQPSSALVEAVARRSDGVPFVVEELVRTAALDRGSAAEQAAEISSVELPWSLSDAVHQQLTGLEHDERCVLDALAVFDDPATFDTLLIVTTLADNTLLAALRSLVARGLVVEVSDDRFWFVHALMADTIAQQLLGRERRRLHERCFEALSSAAVDAPTDYAALARHAIGSGRFDEVAAIARAGARRALASGASFVAVRLAADGLEEEPDDVELLAIATDAAWRLDFPAEASATAERWVQAAEGDDLVDALRLHSRLRFELGDRSGGEATLDRLRELAGDATGQPSVRAAAAAAAAQLCMLTSRSPEAVSLADLAIELATPIGDEITIARAGVERASARVELVSRRESEPELRAAVERARAVGDTVSAARGINNLLAQVPPHTPEGVALRAALPNAAGLAGFSKLGSKTSMWDMEAAMGAGDLATARRAMDEASGSKSAHGGMFDHERAWLAVEEGRFDDAERLLTTSKAAVYCVLGSSNDEFLDSTLRLKLCAFRGDEALGKTEFRALLGRPVPGDQQYILNELVGVAESALSVGIEPAEIREAMLGRWLAHHPSHGELVDHIEGLLSVDDDPARTVELLAPRCANPELMAITRAALCMALARAYIALGDRGRAGETIEQVIDVDLARWPGVRRDRAVALRHRVERSRPEGPADSALTPREQEVALLLTDGLTNGQVAERLYISPKTAAVHVSNILAKLGLSSRAEIAAWTVRNSLEAPGAPKSA